MPKVYKTPMITKVTIILSIITLCFSIKIISKPVSIAEIPQEEAERSILPIHAIQLDLPINDTYYNQPALDPIVIGEETNLNLYIDRVCSTYHVDPCLVRAVIQVESSWNKDAISRDGGHIGLMQLSKKWQRQRADRLGVQDMADPYGNVLVGVDYISYTLDETNGDIAWMLMIYNQGYQSAYANHIAGVKTSYVNSVIRVYQSLKGGAVYA